MRMSVYEWLSIAGVSGIIVAVVTMIMNRILKKHDQKQEAINAEYERKQEEIRQQNEKLEAQNKATMLGVQALLRDRLLSSFRYCISKGFADYNERENIRNMYLQYEALGPNSVMSDLYNQFIELPLQL